MDWLLTHGQRAEQLTLPAQHSRPRPYARHAGLLLSDNGLKHQKNEPKVEPLGFVRFPGTMAEGHKAFGHGPQPRFPGACPSCEGSHLGFETIPRM